MQVAPQSTLYNSPMSFVFEWIYACLGKKTNSQTGFI